MADKNSAPFLKVVKTKSVPTPISVKNFAPSTWQNTLFARSNPDLLVFINFEKADEADFLTVLVAAKLKYLIDVRIVPRFDVGGMNRKLVFSLFAKSGTEYFDVAGRLGIKDRRDARLNPQVLADYLRSMVFRSSGNVEGPIGFLVDGPQFEETYLHLLVDALSAASDRGWEILKVPYGKPDMEPASVTAGASDDKRDLIFLSHATPEDNQFTLWLGTQLACAGYEIWSDVTKLLGGEEFWDTIEDAIRHHAAKVIVILSQQGQTKKGLLDEINCAVSVERTQGIDGFVIPVRIDGLEFGNIRANLARKNVIDFHNNWAHGLSQLMKALERDGVPKKNINGAADTAAWCREHLRSSTKVASKEEELVSNWLPVIGMPRHLLFHDTNAPVGQIDGIVRQLPYPAFRYLRLIGTFAEATDLHPQFPLTERYRAVFEDFVSGSVADLPGIKAKDAHNIVINLIRQGWDNLAVQRGLLPYVTASGAVAWFPPKNLVEGDRVTFTDSAGKRRRKNMVGWSERRQVFWHLAMELKPSLGRIPRLVARAHVVFTTDGKALVESSDRMHALRRRFCKSWWNDRWRDLLLAYSHWLAEDSAHIELAVGAETPILIGREPLRMMAPVSLSGEIIEDEIPDEMLDELDIEEPEDDLADNDWIDEEGASEFAGGA